MPKLSLKLILLLVIFLLSPKFSLAQTNIDPNFNPNRVLEDSQLLNVNSFSLAQIQDFLMSRNSYLAQYYTENAYGVVKSAAEIIYEAATRNYDISLDSKTGVYKCDGQTILGKTLIESEIVAKCKQITTVSPQFLLVLLQKESSVVEMVNPPQTRLDFATGYMIYDGMRVCSPYDPCYRYKGFGKQVNSAALQFRAYLLEPNRYTYKLGGTYNFKNHLGNISQEPLVVTPETRATAALYNYTPHVFDSAYNTFRIWQRFFPNAIAPPTGSGVKMPDPVSRLYPDGSLLKLADDPGIWLIEQGKKRPFLNYASFVSRFIPEQIVISTASELAKYETGTAIRFPNYSLVQTPDKQIYLLVDNKKRPFANEAAFKSFGFNPAELEPASLEDLAMYQEGDPITANSTNITGALWQDNRSGGVYYIENNTKSPLLDKSLLTTKFKGLKIKSVSPAELAKYETIDPVLLPDGTLVKTDAFPTVYLISNGLKRPFANDLVFTGLGYRYQNVITVPSSFLYHYNMGEQIKDLN